MKSINRLFAKFIIGMVFVVPVHAGTLVCDGTVEQVSIHQPGYVLMRLSSMNTAITICSLNSELVVSGSLSGNTTASACKAIYATMLTARSSGRPMTSVYFDGDAVPTGCGSFVFQTHVNIRYFAF